MGGVSSRLPICVLSKRAGEAVRDAVVEFDCTRWWSRCSSGLSALGSVSVAVAVVDPALACAWESVLFAFTNAAAASGSYASSLASDRTGHRR